MKSTRRKLVKRGWGWRINREKWFADRFLSRSTDTNTGKSNLGVAEIMEQVEYLCPIVVRQVILDNSKKRLCRSVPVCRRELVRKLNEVTGSVHLIRSLHLKRLRNEVPWYAAVMRLTAAAAMASAPIGRDPKPGSSSGMGARIP